MILNITMRSVYSVRDFSFLLIRTMASVVWQQHCWRTLRMISPAKASWCYHSLHLPSLAM